MRAAFATLAFLIPVILVPGLATLARGNVEIHMIDVGQGDAVAVRSPKGRWLLVDAGPRSEKFDAGKSRVVPFLLRHNAKRIEAFMISHPHLDHFGGGRAVMQNLRVASIIDPVVPVANAEFDSLLAKSRMQRVTWLQARAGQTFDIDGMRIELLWPDTVALDASEDPNDYSAAFRLSYGRFSALFLGDLSVDAERRMVNEYGGRLDVDVLKVGHHGSATSSGGELLAIATPAVALVSAGRQNRYGHPSPSALERLDAAGAQVFRTDRDGSVSLSAGRDGRMTVRTAQ
jgi:competence protein ComEC